MRILATAIQDDDDDDGNLTATVGNDGRHSENSIGSLTEERFVRITPLLARTRSRGI